MAEFFRFIFTNMGRLFNVRSLFEAFSVAHELDDLTMRAHLIDLSYLGFLWDIKSNSKRKTRPRITYKRHIYKAKKSARDHLRSSAVIYERIFIPLNVFDK